MRNIAFERFVRTGYREPVILDTRPVERKFNPYHDPENGEFTDAAHAGPSSGFARARSGGARTGSIARRPVVGEAPVLVRHSRMTGQAGDVARAVNRIVAEPAATVSLKLGDDRFSVGRKSGDAVELTTGPLGLVKLEGRFSRVAGRQGIRAFSSQVESPDGSEKRGKTSVWSVRFGAVRSKTALESICNDRT